MREPSPRRDERSTCPTAEIDDGLTIPGPLCPVEPPSGPATALGTLLGLSTTTSSDSSSDLPKAARAPRAARLVDETAGDVSPPVSLDPRARCSRQGSSRPRRPASPTPRWPRSAVEVSSSSSSVAGRSIALTRPSDLFMHPFVTELLASGVASTGAGEGVRGEVLDGFVTELRSMVDDLPRVPLVTVDIFDLSDGPLCDGAGSAGGRRVALLGTMFEGTERRGCPLWGKSTDGGAADRGPGRAPGRGGRRRPDQSVPCAAFRPVDHCRRGRRYLLRDFPAVFFYDR